MSKTNTITITLTGPFHDVDGFIHYFEGIRHYINHPPVDWSAEFTSGFRVDATMQYTGSDSEMLQQACEIVEHFPAVRFQFTPADEVEPCRYLRSRMRKGDGFIEFEALQAVCADDPMINMTVGEKIAYVTQQLGYTPESLATWAEMIPESR
jgi:hypothetical protein